MLYVIIDVVVGSTQHSTVFYFKFKFKARAAMGVVVVVVALKRTGIKRRGYDNVRYLGRTCNNNMPTGRPIQVHTHAPSRRGNFRGQNQNRILLWQYRNNEFFLLNGGRVMLYYMIRLRPQKQQQKSRADFEMCDMSKEAV